MFGLGIQEVVIIGIIAVLLFGKRLPEVARSMGGSYREFKKSLGEFHAAMDEPTQSRSTTKAALPYDEFDDYEEATAPKFEPPPQAAKTEESQF
jgi:sec-independent protein translocase protein TatA